MQRVTVTRMGLLARKEQIALASQGLELLEQKRTALMQELRRTADRAHHASRELAAGGCGGAVGTGSGGGDQWTRSGAFGGDSGA